MPEFLNPFSGKIPDRKLSKEELVRAIRLDLSAEEEAVHLYMAHSEATDNPLAKKVLMDIANEERVHVGEFQRLIQILTGDEDKWLSDGALEVNEMHKEFSNNENSIPINPGGISGGETTIGSLKEEP